MDDTKTVLDGQGKSVAKSTEQQLDEAIYAAHVSMKYAGALMKLANVNRHDRRAIVRAISKEAFSE